MKQDRVLLIGKNGAAIQKLARFLTENEFDVELAPPAEMLPRIFSSDTDSLTLVSALAQDGNNVQILRRLRKQCPHLSVIVLAANSNSFPGIAQLREGTIDHLVCPDHPAGVLSAVRSEKRKRSLQGKLKTLLEDLTQLRLAQSKDMKRALELEEIYNTTLENLMTALDLRDVETFGHSLTVAKYSLALAKLLGITDQNALDNIRRGALLHDVGKIAIPDSILKKPTRLSGEEWEKVRLHPTLGYGLIKEIKVVQEVGNIILFHHERYDGAGYPRGLKKESIPLEARIFALADALDAITSHRPYRKERDFRTAKKEILEHSGTQFDPKVVEAFCSVGLARWEKTRYETTKILPDAELISGLSKNL